MPLEQYFNNTANIVS